MNAAAPLFSGASVAANDAWITSTNASYDLVTDTVLNSNGGWGGRSDEMIQQYSGSLARTILKMQIDIDVEALKQQAREFLATVVDDEGNPLDESTISSLLEGPKGIFSGNPGSLNYVDPKTGLNKIQTMVVNYGEKYQAALVEIGSGQKTQEEANSIMESVSQQINASVKENFFGNSQGTGKLGLLLAESGKYLQAKENQRKLSEQADEVMAQSIDDAEDTVTVGQILDV